MMKTKNFMNFLFLAQIKSILYLSMDIIYVDDCIYKIYSKNNNDNLTYFSMKPENVSKCKANVNSYYPNNGAPIIENIEFTIGQQIFVEVYNNGGGSSLIPIVRINEYFISLSYYQYWTCIYCQNYGPKSDSLQLAEEGNKCKNKTFSLYFQINNFEDFNSFETNNTFFSLTSQKTFNYSIYYKNGFLELINFNTTNAFYVTRNRSLEVNYTNYKFLIEFMNDFNGTLIGLNSNNLEIELNNKDYFYVTESKGLKYILSSEDRKNQSLYLNFRIQAYNVFSKPITKKEDFIFNIILNGNNLLCLNKEIYITSDDIYHYNCSNYTLEELNNNLLELITRANDNIGRKYVIKGKDIIINISPLKSVFFNISKIYNLSHCDEILRDVYQISSSNTITFMKINNENSNELIYVYDDNSNLLDISFCDELYDDKIYYNYDNKTQIFYTILNKTKEELIKNISEILDNVEIGKKYEIKGDDYYIKISPTNTTHLSSVSHVNFTICENILREQYNISKSRYITFLQMEINNTNSKTLINKIEYQAYDDNKKNLNLSLCEDNYIKITHSIKSSSLFDKVLASLFKDLGIDIFNIDDSFFTDVCHSYSDSENDMTLKDRIKEIFQNFSMCEEGCYYDEIDLENMTVTCNCKVKADLNVDDITVTLLPYQDKNANFEIIKCYNLVFSLKGKKINIGFWIFLVLVSAHIPLLIIYCYKGIKPVSEYIFQQMKIYGYIKSDNYKSKKIDVKKNKNMKPKKNRKNNPPRKNDKINDKKKVKKQQLKNNKKHKSRILNKAIKIKMPNAHEKSIKIKNEMSLDASGNNNLFNSKQLINNIETQAKKEYNKLSTNKAKNKKSKEIKDNKKENQNNNIFNFNIININLNKREEYTPQSSNQILNNYTFKEAIEYDYRSICLIYYIILLSKQAIFHAFLYKSPLEVFSLRLCLLIFIYSSDLALNAIFYLDDKISEKYHYAHNFFLFAFSNNITVILLSTLVGFLFMTLFTNLSNSSNEIRNIFRNEEEKLMKNKKYIVSDKRKEEIKLEIEKILKKFKIKMIILIIIEFLLMLFFWYYVTAFCHVYNSTQYSWLFDSFLSILSRSFLDFLIPLGLAKLYRLSVESNVECIYKIVLFFYSFA